MRHFLFSFLLCFVFCFANAKRVYVSEAGTLWADGSSWESATSDLCSALLCCSAGDSVWVAVGTYYGGFLMPEGVTVLGGFLGTETSEQQRLLPMYSSQRSVLCGKHLYRVLEQPTDYDMPSAWDGFAITQGIGQMGAGVLLRRNGVLRNCIIEDNAAGMPAVGEYLPQEGGLVLFVNASTRRAVIMSAVDYGRHYQHTRGKEAVSQCSEGGKSDWRLPSNSELLYLTSAVGDGLYAFSPSYYLLENKLKISGNDVLSGKRYWASNTATESGNPVAYCLHTTNAQSGRLSALGYCRIRPVRSVTLSSADGVGGGVYATSGSTLSGCMVSNNTAAEDEDIHAEGEVLILDIDDKARLYFMARNDINIPLK